MIVQNLFFKTFEWKKVENLLVKGAFDKNNSVAQLPVSAEMDFFLSLYFQTVWITSNYLLGYSQIFGLQTEIRFYSILFSVLLKENISLYQISCLECSPSRKLFISFYYQESRILLSQK